MNPPHGWGYYCQDEIHFCQHQILKKKSFSLHIIPKTKGLEERLLSCNNGKPIHPTSWPTCKDLANTSFVTSPDLYDQYISDLGGVLDRHAPLIYRRAKKTPAGWLSDSYRRAKSIRRQFERMWREDRSQLSRSRFHRLPGAKQS